MTLTREQDTFRERYDSHTDEERERARARLRVAGASFRRIEKLYAAAVEERKNAVINGAEVGLSVKAMAEDLETDHGAVGRLRRNRHGERAAKS